MAETKKKKKIIITKVVDGIDTEVEIEVDDVDGPQWLPKGATRLIGKPIQRLDGPDKVTGKARYPVDVRLPGMLWGRWVPSAHANARIVSVDLGPARRLAGVKVVIELKHAEDVVRFHGDPIAAVAATTPEIADDAVHAIKVQYDVLPHAITVEQALAPGAPSLRANQNGNISRRNEQGNKAEVAEALEGCAHVVELELSTPIKPHVCFETHGVVVDYRGGDSATIHASTQGVFTISQDAAKWLGIPVGNVETNCQHMGSGYGSKFSLGKDGEVGCRLAKEAKLPVHMLLTRRDEFLAAGNRSASIQKIKLGCDNQGKLIAIDAEQIRLGGLGRGSQPGHPYVYKVEKVYRDVYSVHTNIDSSRAWRAPGHPQASFGMESVVDELSYKAGIDGVEFRKRNLEDPMHRRHLDEGAAAIGWHRRNRVPGQGAGAIKRGIGCAVGVWGGGGRPICEVDVIVQRDGSVTCRCGTQDLGTGTRTYMAMITAEELGLEVADINVQIGRSIYGNANPSGGSTTVPSLAPAVKHAAYQTREELSKRAAAVLGVKPEDVRVQVGKFAGGSRSLTWKQVAALVPPEGLSLRGVWQPDLASRTTHPAQFAEVEVDTETGHVRVIKIVAVQDCGLCLNPLTTESQLQGGVIQSMSYALLEARVDDPTLGMCLNPNMEDYKVVGTTEMPEEVQIIIDDKDDRPVVGIGEPPVIPTQSAIANAVYNAIGVRITSLPITPDKVLMALEQEGRRA